MHIEGCYPGTELTALADAPNYYEAILREFSPYLGSRVVEIGAGIGTCSEYLLRYPQIKTLTLIEPASNLISILREKLSGDARVRLVNGPLKSVAESLSSDSVVLINVLEHVEDEEDLLRTIRHILKPNGALLLFVPALPMLYGSLDKAFGHVRRYRKAELRLQVEKHGFKIVNLRYFNLPGIVAWFVAGKVLNRKSLRARDARVYDRWIMSWVGRLEQMCHPPIGQSLLVVATV